MVASTSPFATRFAIPPAPFVAGMYRVPRFTRRDAETLVRIGIIPEDANTELLSGLIVLVDRSACHQDPTMIGQVHRKCVERLSALRKTIDTAARHVETQQPLVCTETHVPQPDFMVLRGTLESYADLPTAADAFCVVEVADSSYERDVGPKLTAYAQAGIAQYVVINLRNRTAELYTRPDATAGTYAGPQILRESDALPLRVGEADTFAVKLSDVLH
jgi:hypothetical protein